MFRVNKYLALGTVLTAMSPVTAAAKPGGAPFIPAGDRADAPEGFVELCERDVVLCRAGLPIGGQTAAAAPSNTMTAPGGCVVDADFDPMADLRTSAGALAIVVRIIRVEFFAPQLAGSTPCSAKTSAPGAGVPIVGQPVGGDGSVPVIGAPLAPGAFGTAALTLARSQVGKWRDSDRTPAYQPGQSADADLSLIKLVNHQVNRRVVQMSDLANNGVEEIWTRPVNGRHPAGDCEDIAIEKRMRLIEAGFPPNRLFYAVVYRANFGLHTILIARMAGGDVVLDSAAPDVLAWSQVRYVWLRVQSPNDPMQWRRVGQPSVSGSTFAAATTAPVAS